MLQREKPRRAKESQRKAKLRSSLRKRLVVKPRKKVRRRPRAKGKKNQRKSLKDLKAISRCLMKMSKRRRERDKKLSRDSSSLRRTRRTTDYYG